MQPNDIINIAIALGGIHTIAASLPENCKLKRVAKKGIIKAQIKRKPVPPLSLNECLNFDENNYIIELFMKTLEEKFSHCDLSSFYRNIKSLKISDETKKRLRNLNTLATYSVNKNKITNYENKELEKLHVILHELFHMASSVKSLFSTFCGFRKAIAGFEVGRGLNEGYTEYLTAKYFPRYQALDSYQELQMVAFGFENLIGSKKMEALYFKNDLEGLMKELEPYATREEILTLLIKTDRIHAIENKDDPDYSLEAARLQDEVQTSLANMNIKRLQNEKLSGKMSEEEFIPAVYSAMLYANGYVVHKFHEHSGGNIYIPSKSPTPKFGEQLLSQNYLEFAKEYYSNHKDDIYVDYQKVTTSEYKKEIEKMLMSCERIRMYSAPLEERASSIPQGK